MLGQFVIGALVATSLFLAFRTRDWRLKWVASGCAACWLISTVIDNVGPAYWWLDPIYSTFMIGLLLLVQARGKRERRAGVPLAMWILLPLTCEFGIVFSHTLWSVAPLTGFYVMQVFFVLELISIIYIGFVKSSVMTKNSGSLRSFTQLR
jgi:hypothetical protein